MRSFFAASFLLAVLFTVGCASHGAAVTKLDESSAKAMLENYLNTNHYQYEVSINRLFPFLVDAHSRQDYRTGKAGRYGSLLARLLQQGFINQQTGTSSYPEVSGTFRNAFNKGYGITERDSWMLSPVPGTNELQGQCKESTNPNPAYCCTWTGKAQGTIEPDGRASLSCSLSRAFSANTVQPARYIEHGTIAYLKIQDLGTTKTRTFTGPASGKRVTATWYAYALTPQFKALLKHNGNEMYVVAGNYEVEKITDLRLDTQTRASASFSLTVSKNSTGKLLFPAAGLGGTWQVLFGKKPDQTWVIDSISVPDHPLPLL